MPNVSYKAYGGNCVPEGFDASRLRSMWTAKFPALYAIRFIAGALATKHLFFPSPWTILSKLHHEAFRNHLPDPYQLQADFRFLKAGRVASPITG